MNAPAKDVDAYLAMQTETARTDLEQLRQIIKAAAPGAEETIGYGMPMYKLNGQLVAFAAAKNHYGFYPCNGATVIKFKDELKGYDTTKGSIHLPIDKPLPVALIKKIIKSRIQENAEKAKLKKEAEAKPKQGLLPKLGAPAQRALANAGIATLKQLSAHSEASIRKLHGMGPSSIPKLKQALAEQGMTFKQ